MCASTKMGAIALKTGSCFPYYKMQDAIVVARDQKIKHTFFLKYLVHDHFFFDDTTNQGFLWMPAKCVLRKIKSEDLFPKLDYYLEPG